MKSQFLRISYILILSSLFLPNAFSQEKNDLNKMGLSEKRTPINDESRLEQIKAILSFNKKAIKEAFRNNSLSLEQRQLLVSRLVKERSDKIRLELTEEERRTIIKDAGIINKRKEQTEKRNRKLQSLHSTPLQGSYLKDTNKKTPETHD